MLTSEIVRDGHRLMASALWGSTDWTVAALVGIAGAAPGLLWVFGSMRRQTLGRSPANSSSELGFAYLGGVLIMFVVTHRKFGRQPPVDSPIMVAALVCQLVLLIGTLGLIALSRPIRRLVLKTHGRREASTGPRETSPSPYRQTGQKRRRSGARWRRRRN